MKEIDINKEQLTERLIYLVEIKILQNKPRNGVNSFNIINNESESSVSPFIEAFPDWPIIKDFSNTKLNDNDKPSSKFIDQRSKINKKNLKDINLGNIAKQAVLKMNQ